MASLQRSAKCRCGYCHIADVESHEQDDHMESFFLAETVGDPSLHSLHIIIVFVIDSSFYDFF